MPATWLAVGPAVTVMVDWLGPGPPRIGVVDDVPDPFPGVPSKRLPLDRLDEADSCDLLVVTGAVAADHRAELARVSGDGASIVVLDARDGVGDLRLATSPDAAGPWLPPAIDPLVANPVGWRRHPPLRMGVAPTTHGEPTLDWIRAHGEDAVVLLDRSTAHLRDLVEERTGAHVTVSADERLVDRLRRFVAVVDDPGWHDDHGGPLRILLMACAAGTPVVAAPVHPLQLLDVPVVEASPNDLAAAVGELAADVDERERASVVARRAVLWRHSGHARLNDVLELLGEPRRPPPLVSVVLASNRPEMIDHGIRSVASQRYPAMELVLVLHGQGFPVPPSVARLDVPVRVVRVSQERTLGEALNVGVAAASGDLVTKMDDDDLYGRDHVLDLVLAMRYSGADLVGKRIDHVWVRGRDVTIVRARSSPERVRDHVGGPTLMLSAALARRQPFPAVTGREDTLLLESLRARGGRIYGTHSLDVVLHRHERNTWEADLDVMVADAEHVSEGLDLDRAASEPGAFSAPRP